MYCIHTDKNRKYESVRPDTGTVNDNDNVDTEGRTGKYGKDSSMVGKCNIKGQIGTRQVSNVTTEERYFCPSCLYPIQKVQNGAHFCSQNLKVGMNSIEAIFKNKEGDQKCHKNQLCGSN